MGLLQVGSIFPSTITFPLAEATSSRRLFFFFFFKSRASSLLLRQSAELRRRAARSPGFLRTAVPCYAGLLRLFLEGGVAEPPQVSEPRLFIFLERDDVGGKKTPSLFSQVEPFRILSRAKQFLLGAIPQTPPGAASSSGLREVTAPPPTIFPYFRAPLETRVE